MVKMFQPCLHLYFFVDQNKLKFQINKIFLCQVFFVFQKYCSQYKKVNHLTEKRLKKFIFTLELMKL